MNALDNLIERNKILNIQGEKYKPVFKFPKKGDTILYMEKDTPTIDKIVNIDHEGFVEIQGPFFLPLGNYVLVSPIEEHNPLQLSPVDLLCYNIGK